MLKKTILALFIAAITSGLNIGFAETSQEPAELQEELRRIEKDIKVSPKNPGLWTIKGITLRKLGRYDEAQKAHWKAIKIDPEFVNAWNNRGVVLYWLEKYDGAIWAFNRAIKIDSTFRLAWKNKAGTLDMVGRHDEAVKAYQRAAALVVALEGREDEQAWHNMGIALAKLRRYEEALRVFHKVIQLNPDSAQAHSILGEVFFRLGNRDSAYQKAEDALSINENNASALSLKGKIQIEQQEYDSAQASFEKAIPFDVGEPRLLVWHSYAEYLAAEFSSDSEGKEYQEKILSIIRELDRAQEIAAGTERDEMRACALYFLGYFYYKGKDIFTAKEKLQQCIEIESSVKASAREMLNYIWDYEIRPPWWRWWLDSPTYGWTTRLIFGVLMGLILVLFWLPALKVKWFVSDQAREMKSLLYILYISFVALLVIIVMFPRIESIKAKEIEIELRTPPPFEFILSPAIMEAEITKLQTLPGR
jgi:tetratricopeptide (TPR) repeat protein